MRYDGAAMETVEIPGVPDATPDNGIPAGRVFDIAASADGSLWAVGYLAADPDQAVLARFDGAAWTLYEEPLPASRATRFTTSSLAAGPDGTAWFAFDGGLRSFDGRRLAELPGRGVSLRRRRRPRRHRLVQRRRRPPHPERALTGQGPRGSGPGPVFAPIGRGFPKGG